MTNYTLQKSILGLIAPLAFLTYSCGEEISPPQVTSTNASSDISEVVDKDYENSLLFSPDTQVKDNYVIVEPTSLLQPYLAETTPKRIAPTKILTADKKPNRELLKAKPNLEQKVMLPKEKTSPQKSEYHPQKLSSSEQEIYARLSQPDRLVGYQEQFEKTQKYDKLIRAKAEKYDIPYSTLFALVIVESGGNPKARSGKSSASGLMQMLDGTAQEQGCYKNRTNPEVSLECGAKYLHYIHKQLHKRLAHKKLDEQQLWNLTLAGYHDGVGGITGSLQRNKCDTLEQLYQKSPKYEYELKIRVVERIYQEYLNK